MSFLDELIQGASGTVTDYSKRTGNTDAVKSDRFDARLVQEMRDTVPAYADVVSEFRARPDSGATAEAMLQDIYLEFWKGAPEIREKASMAKTHLLNHGVADTIMNAPEMPDARRLTIRDQYSSVIGTLAVTDKIREYLDRNEELEKQQQEQQEAQDALQEAMQNLMQALADAQGAGNALDGEMGDFPGIGPLTEAQAAAMGAAQEAGEALQAAMDAAKEAEQAEQESGEQFTLSTTVATAKMRPAIQEAIEKVGDDLQNEVNLFHSWGLEDGDIKTLDFNERAALARRLRSSKFSKYVDYLGRTRLVGAGLKYQKVEFGREEVVGTELSGDMPRVMASEWARGRHPMLRLQFLSDFAERRLLSKKMVGREIVGKGAIVCCVDNSGSMRDPYGSTRIPREVPAKATALALLDEAKRQRRDFVLINFSSPNQVKAYRFMGGNAPIEQVVAAIEHFWDGGTAFEQPLDLATKMLREEFNGKKRKAGDIVFITDGDAPINDAWLTKHRAAKAELGFRTFGISIGARASSALHRFSDDVREVWDLSNADGLTDVMRHI